MSLRLVKQQLAALSKTQAVPEECAAQSDSAPKQKTSAGNAVKVKQGKTLKKKSKQNKAAASKGLNEEEIRQRNMKYYTSTAGKSKATESMVQVNDLLSVWILLPKEIVPDHFEISQITLRSKLALQRCAHCC